MFPGTLPLSSSDLEGNDETSDRNSSIFIEKKKKKIEKKSREQTDSAALSHVGGG